MRRGVVVVGPVPPPIHGAARVTALVVAELRAAGAAPTVIDTSGTASGIGWRHHALRIGLHLRAAVTLLLRRPRAVYVTGAGGLGLWYSLAVIAAARLAGSRVVFHHHSYAYLNEPARVMRLITTVAGPQSLHVVLAERMERDLRARYPVVGEVLVCSNAGLLPPPESRDDDDRAGVVLGHLGNLHLDKGFAEIVDTLRAVRAAGTDARLVLGGPVRHDAAQRLLEAAQSEFGDAVEYVGPVPPDRVDDLYRRCDVFLLPSRWKNEAEPLVVLEAARVGVPAIAYDVGCLGDLVPPDALVDTAADFGTEAAKSIMTLAGIDRAGRRAEATRRFAARRDGALAAQRNLIRELTG